MPTIRIATEADLRRAVPLDRPAIDCVAGAFVALAEGRATMPPILRLDIPAANGEVDVKTAHIEGLPAFAIKISPGFFDNPGLGLPSVNGLMTLFSATTGLLEAVLLDNGYLTDVRTAAAGAVAAEQLARPEATTVTVLGAGVQARLQLEALALVRKLTAATIWARDHDRAQETALAMAETLGIPVGVTRDPGEAVSRADIVLTTTPAAAPVLQAGWLRSGQHVTAMGSDAEHKNEVDPAVFAREGLVYVADSVAQTRRLGELHHAIAAGTAAADAAFPELGALVTGTAEGRTSAEQITLCDLTGTGVQDTAIATLALQRLDMAGMGTTFDS
jgi:ornithine cyclodeaminase